MKLKLKTLYEKVKIMITYIRIGYEWTKHVDTYVELISQKDVPQIFSPDWEEKILGSK